MSRIGIFANAGRNWGSKMNHQPPTNDTSLTVAGKGEDDYCRKEFNYATMVCLPKKAAGVHAQLGEFYTPENTRPLSIVNTDNHLIANAYRMVLEPIASEWVSLA